jgi:hypothetical protein
VKAFLFGDQDWKRRQAAVNRWSQSLSGWMIAILLNIVGAVAGHYARLGLQVLRVPVPTGFLQEMLLALLVGVLFTVTQRVAFRFIAEQRRPNADRAAWCVMMFVVGFVIQVWK